MALTQQQSPIYAARLTVRGPSSSDIDRAAVEGVLSLPCVRDFVQGPLFVRGPSAQVVAAKVFLKRAALRAEQRGWAGMFDPAQAYAADRLWQAAPLRRLVRSKVRLAGGGVSPDGRISLGAAVRASVEPWLPGRGHAGLSLLARKPEGAPPVLARLAPTVERGVSSRLLAECAEALLATAELGTLRYGAEQNTQAAALARRLEGAGLLPLADAMSGVADARSDGGAAVLLRAVHILDRTQAHARPFAWLERSA